MPTTWLPADTPDKRIWVLDNYKVVEAPEMEISSGGRRTRIKNEPETSVFTKDRDTVIKKAIERIADRENASILACTRETRARNHAEATLSLPRVTVDDSTEKLKSIALTWVFKHPHAPLYARLSARLDRQYHRSAPYEVEMTCTFDEISERSQHDPHTGEVRDRNWSVGSNNRYWSDIEREKREQLEASPLTALTKRVQCRSEREALQKLREHLEVLDRQLSIPIPDVRGSEVRWITYNFLRTNLDGQFTADLNAYLDSEATVLEAYEAYQQLREALRRLGIKFPTRSEEDFARALTLQDSEALSIDVPVDDHDGKQRRDHEVVLHLASGTITVLCDNDVDSRHVAEEWTLARFEAEMRGELEAFLAFQSSTRERRRHQTIAIARKRQSKPEEAS